MGTIPQSFFKIRFAVGIVVLSAVSLFGIAVFTAVAIPAKQVKADQPAPLVYIQYGDSGNTGPNLPGECSNQIAGEGTSTYDGSDPDCLRIRIVNPDTFTQDFQFCLTYNGQTSCSPWASDSQGYYAQGGMVSGNHSGNLSGTMTAYVNTRPVTDAGLPAGTTFSGAQAGVALAYQKDYNACQSSSGIQMSPFNSDQWSGWAYGAAKDNDPGCFSAALYVNSINIPADAWYISNSLPTGTLSRSTSYNGNYSVTFKNRGTQWMADKVVRPLDGHCNEGTFDYSNGATCDDYIISSSDRFRLERIDSTPVQIRSRQLRANSNDVTYNGSSYNYAGPEVSITANANRGSVSPDNTVPFFVRQDVHYQKFEGFEEICTPGPVDPGPGPGGDQPVDQGPNQIQAMNWHSKISAFLNTVIQKIVPAAHAMANNAGDTCSYTYYNYISATYQPWSPNVQFDDNIQLSPINITTPDTGGNYTVQLRMVDLNNLGNYSAPYQGGQFGQTGSMTVAVEADPLPLGASMSATSPVFAGGSTSLNWNSTNATSCQQWYAAPGGGWTLLGAPYGTTSGSSSFPISAVGTYSFLNRCFGTNTTPSQIDAIAYVTSNFVNLDATISASASVAHMGSSSVSWNSPSAAAGTTCQQYYTNPSGQTTVISNSLSGSASVGPLAGPGTYTFYNSCTNSNASPNQRIASATTSVGTPSVLDCSLTAGSPNPPIAYNGTTLLTWSTSNASSVQIYREQTYGAGNWAAVSGLTGTSGSYRTPQLTAQTRYLCQANGTNTNPSQANTIVDIPVSAPLPLDATVSATSPVTVGQNTTLSWNSTNAQTCQVYREQTYNANDWTAVSGANTVPSGSQSFGPFTSAGSYRFKNQCANPDTSPTVYSSVPVTVQVVLPLTGDLKCKGPSDSSAVNSCILNYNDSAVITWSSTGTDCQVRLAGNVIWSRANDTSGTRSTGPMTSDRTYDLYCIPATGGGYVSVDSTTVQITAQRPTGMTVDVITSCGAGNVTWSAPSGPVTGYNVYRSTDGSVWQKITGPLSSSTFSYYDTPPTGSYYYGVTAVNGTLESTKAQAGPATVRACAGNVSNSDNDIIAVTPAGIDTTKTNIQPCNAQSDPISLNDGKSFKVNDVITMNVNVCNSGDAAALGVHVSDTLSNLSSPRNYSYTGCTGSAVASGSNVTFTIGDVPAHQTCTITFTVTVTKPASGNIYRFQNAADITSSNLPLRRVVTPAYLFTDVSGSPDRNEIAP